MSRLGSFLLLTVCLSCFAAPPGFAQIYDLTDPMDPAGAPGIGLLTPIAPYEGRGGGGTILCTRSEVCSRDGLNSINGEAAIADGLFWQTDFNDRRLRLFDSRDGCRVIKAISVPGGGPSENAFDGQYVYHYNFSTGLIYVYDPDTCELVNQCDAPGDDIGEGMTFDGEYLWKGDSSRLYRFEVLQDGTCNVVDSFPYPDNDAADGLGYCDGLLIMLGYSGLIYQIDPTTRQVVGMCRLNNGNRGNGVTADGNLRVAVDQPTSIDLLEIKCGEPLSGAEFGVVSPCGDEFMLTVGVPFDYLVSIVEPTDERVTLEAIELPPGAQHFPALPIDDFPAFASEFTWTPTNADIGRHVAFYAATVDNVVSVCRVTMVVAECYLILGRSHGDTPFEAGGYTFETQLGEIYDSYPVVIDNIPAFPLRNAKTAKRGGTAIPAGTQSRLKLIDRFYAQVLMHNPEVFPENAEQSTHGLEVSLWSNGTATARPFGTRDGMDIALEIFTDTDGQNYFRLPFDIDGV